MPRPTDDSQDGVEVLRFEDDVSFLVADLFKATFNDPPPAEPVHYVAIDRTGPSRFFVAGYYHVTYRREYALVGGLCVAPEYRRRGIGERLERIALEYPQGALGFYAHVGDPARSARVGFRATQHPHLVVNWVQATTPDDQARITEEVAGLGPF